MPTVPLGEAAATRSPAPAGGLRPGSRLGRYVVSESIGSGGAGVVYAAFDAKLDRKVALKLLERSPSAQDATVDPGWPRLVREARMLAKLNDPAVVTVFDVGEHEGLGYLAMEHVSGGDLRDWIEAHRGPEATERTGLRATLRLLSQAGDGLLAAHQAGVVHGDFKPANVLLDARGRAKVSDFGIARLRAAAAFRHEVAAGLGNEKTVEFDAETAGGGSALANAPVVHSVDASGAPSVDASAEPSADRSGSITEDDHGGGRMAGTPAYMAPEQFEGHGADESTDVYAFCVTLFHAVYGVLPWSGGSVLELVTRKTLQPPTRPAAVRVPRWLDRLLERGLAADRAQRWTAMPEVLAALRAGLGAPRRRAWIAGGSAATVALVAGWALGGAQGAASDALCAQPDGIGWTDDAKAQLGAAFEGAGHPNPTEAWSRVDTRLQALSETWGNSWEQACGEEEASAFREAALRCLTRQRTASEALQSAWMDASTEPQGGYAWIDRAVVALGGLAEPAECLDPVRLADRSQVPTDPKQREQVVAIREQLDAAAAFTRTGRPAIALPIAQAALADAETAAFGPVVAEAAVTVARALELTGALEESAELLRRAYFAGGESEAHGVAADAAIRLIHVAGVRLELHDEGLLWAKHAEVEAKRTDARVDQLISNRGGVYERKGDYDQATLDFRAALEASPPDDLYAQGISHSRLADVLRTEGHAEEAISHYDQTIVLWSEALGEHHPNVAVAKMSKAAGLARDGRLEEAVPAFRTAIANLESAFGREHPNVSAGYVNLGISLKNLGQLDAAAEAMRTSLDICIAVYGADNRKTGHRREALGRLLTRMGDPEAALVQHQAAAQIYGKTLEAGHPSRLLNEMNLGDAHRAAGRFADALVHYASAQEGAHSHRPADDPLRPDTLAFYGRALVDAGQVAEAVPVLERAIEALAKLDGYTDVLAQARFALARALGERAATLPRARKLAAAAEAGLAGKVEDVAAWTAWTQEHSAP